MKSHGKANHSFDHHGVHTTLFINTEFQWTVLDSLFPLMMQRPPFPGTTSNVLLLIVCPTVRLSNFFPFAAVVWVLFKSSLETPLQHVDE